MGIVHTVDMQLKRLRNLVQTSSTTLEGPIWCREPRGARISASRHDILFQ